MLVQAKFSAGKRTPQPLTQSRAEKGLDRYKRSHRKGIPRRRSHGKGNRVHQRTLAWLLLLFSQSKREDTNYAFCGQSKDDATNNLAIRCAKPPTHTCHFCLRMCTLLVSMAGWRELGEGNDIPSLRKISRATERPWKRFVALLSTSMEP